jgi:hypothetical protein
VKIISFFKKNWCFLYDSFYHNAHGIGSIYGLTVKLSDCSIAVLPIGLVYLPIRLVYLIIRNW